MRQRVTDYNDVLATQCAASETCAATTEVSSSGTASPSALAVGGLRLDLLKREVVRDGTVIDLQPREFALLEYLMRNAGRVVTRPELLSEVWEDPRHTHSNVIDVYASRLRRKIDEGEAVPMIATSRGVGYMIDVPPTALRSERGSSRSPEEG